MNEPLSDDSRKWIGVVPAHWKHLRLGSCFRERSAPTTAEQSLPLSVTKSGTVDQQAHVAKSQEGAPKKRVERGDLVINSRSDRKGSAGIAPREGSVSLINIVLEPRGIQPKFAHHLLRSIAFQEEFFRYGSGIVDDLWTTRYSTMKNIQLPIPPPAEQIAIADYLDHETAEIDAFISDQEHLRKLALERATSSRVRQFGQPTDRRARIRQLAQIVNGSGFPVAEQGETGLELPFFKVGSLGSADRGFLSFSANTVSHATASRLGARVLPSGSIVMAKIGAALYLNRNAVLERPSCIDNNLMGLIPLETVTTEFLQQLLLTLDLKPLGNPGAVPSLNLDWFKDLEVWLPDLDTQGQIVQQFNSEKTEVDSLVSDLERAQLLSHERRAALISAAVTGQIDVTKRHKPVAEQLEDEVLQKV